MPLIDPSAWAEFNSLINEVTGATGDFSSKIVKWYRAQNTISEFREDPQVLFEMVELRSLHNYNYMRSWPITNFTESGELDRQSVQVLFNKDYLKTLGYINSEGYFNFKADYDRFEFDGFIWKAVGDTPVSQSITDDLFIVVIFKREETNTGGFNMIDGTSPYIYTFNPNHFSSHDYEIM